MNYKLEKFWNKSFFFVFKIFISMNYKLEKFWNSEYLKESEKDNCNEL